MRNVTEPDFSRVLRGVEPLNFLQRFDSSSLQAGAGGRQQSARPTSERRQLGHFLPQLAAATTRLRQSPYEGPGRLRRTPGSACGSASAYKLSSTNTAVVGLESSIGPAPGFTKACWFTSSASSG